MGRTTFSVAVLACLSSTWLQADFSYQQSSKLTGGMMAGAMKVVGVFSKQAREPIQTQVMVKGDRMAQYSGDTAQIIDISAETITNLDFKKKQYSVLTFAQMKQFMEKMSEKMAQQGKGKKEAELDIKVKVDDTGRTKEISGMNTREMIMTMEMEGTDPESGQSGAMVFRMDSWLAPSVSGYDEVKNFYQRMAQKLAWMPGSGFGAFGRGSPGASKGMSELYREAAKLDGVPVLQITTMSMKGQGGEAPPAGGAEQPAARSQEQESLKGAIGRSLGGFGRFGRRKKEEPAQEQPAPEAKAPAGAGGGSGALMEVTTELGGFSTAAIDPSKFETPGGFKQVESEMEKALR